MYNVKNVESVCKHTYLSFTYDYHSNLEYYSYNFLSVVIFLSLSIICIPNSILLYE